MLAMFQANVCLCSEGGFCFEVWQEVGLLCFGNLAYLWGRVSFLERNRMKVGDESIRNKFSDDMEPNRPLLIY